MRLIALAILAFAGTAAIGQTTTNCNTYGNQVNCRSQTQPAYVPPPPIQQFSVTPLLGALQARRAEQERQQAQDSSQQQEARRSEMRAYAGHLINDGKCDQALAYMLNLGELQMAGEVKALCAK